MKPPYTDITQKLGKPIWWDDNGVPRYCDFHPSHAPSIYAREVLLFRIKCQNCGADFDVTCTASIFAFLSAPLMEAVKDHKIHYGDPPNYDCCGAGPTMNSEPVRVLQYWVQKPIGKWKELEEFRNQPLD